MGHAGSDMIEQNSKIEDDKESISKRNSGVYFNLICPLGPKLAHHVGCVIGNFIYIHGGINKSRSIIPSNVLHKYNFKSGLWSQERAKGSPSLSYHAGVPFQQRYMMLIGGWNGRARTHDIYIFDTLNQKWSFHPLKNFPEGSGLTSHSAILLNDEKTILVIGREGSLKTQRRYTSVFIIRGEPEGVDGFTCTQLPHEITSRSGHSVHLYNSKLLIIGGRDDKVLETYKLDIDKAIVGKMSALCSKDQLAKSTTDYQEEIMKPRKYHVSVLCNSGKSVFIHGGWTFDGKEKFPVSEMYLALVKSPAQVSWIKLNDSGVKLAGHVLITVNDKIFVHGGESEGGFIEDKLYEIIDHYK